MKVSEVKLIVNKYRGESWALISILQDLQEREGYLPRDVLSEVAKRMNVGLPQVYGVATFFRSLSLVPQGRHRVTLCLGTACHVRGGPRILDEVTRLLKIMPDGTTDDGLFTLKVVNCLGACAIGPVMMVDDKYYGDMSASRAKRILDDYRKRTSGKAKEHS